MLYYEDDDAKRGQIVRQGVEHNVPVHRVESESPLLGLKCGNRIAAFAFLGSSTGFDWNIECLT